MVILIFLKSQIFHTEKIRLLKYPINEKLLLRIYQNVIFPIYDDYFEQHKIYTPNIKPLIPIEHSRGCHWNRCHFCYLNIGYKYRKKNINKLNIEIEHMLKRYQSNGFVFLDNDLIGNDVNHFELLLESFINIRKKIHHLTYFRQKL